MRRWVIGCLVAAGAGGVAIAAEEPTYGVPPAWIQDLAIPPAPSPDQPSALQALLWNTQIRFGPQGRDIFNEAAVRIGTPAGLAAMGNVIETWDPQTDTLTVNHVRILRDRQVIDALAGGRRLTVLHREQELEANMLDGRLTGTLQLEGLQVGDVVDVAVTQHTYDPQLKGHSEAVTSLNHVGLASRMYLRESWPDGTPVRWRSGADLPQPTTTHVGGRTELVYDLKDVVTPPMPNGAPARYALADLVQASDFADWAQVSALMAPLYDQAGRITPGSELQKAVDRIRAANHDPMARALAALRLVQDQVRYLYIGLNNGAYVPAAAELTWSRRFGDCKGKTALLLAILRALDIQAEPALLNSVLGDGLDSRLPMLSDFDHVLVRATIDGQIYWLDGTRLGDQTLEDGRSTDFHWALPLQASGARLEPLPALDVHEPLKMTEATLDLTVGVDGPVRMHVDRSLRGDAAYLAHASLEALDPKAQDRSLRQIWSGEYAWASLDKVGFTYDASRRVLHMTVDGSGKMEWSNTAAGRDLNMEDTSLAWEASFRRDPGPHQDAPYAVSHPNFTEAKITVILPDGGRAATLLNGADVNETVAGVAYHRSARIADGRMTVDLSERSLAAEFPASEAPSAQIELQRLYDHDLMLRYSAAAAPMGAVAADPLPPEIGHDDTAADAAEFARRGADDMAIKAYAVAVADFTAAIQVAPKASKYVYDRGVAHYKAGELVLAQADFDAALKLDPDDSFVHTARGELAILSGDLPLARRELAATLAHAPDRQAVLQRFGNLYEKIRDYPDTIAVMDQWVADKPDDRVKSEALNRRCWARAEWGRQLDDALKDCDASLQIAPNRSATLDSRALVELRLGKLDAAISDATAALKAHPTLASSLYVRGLAELHNGAAKAGDADLKAAAAADPRTPQTYGEMGVKP